jgi:hypothetical protein
MIASAADDQQWNTFMLTDAVQDGSAAEQKRTLVERGQVLYNAPDEAMEDYECMADCVNDCDALLAFMEAGGGTEGSTMMGTDDVALGDHVDKDVVLGEELPSIRFVGIDTDSSRGASIAKADFLYLNCAPKRQRQAKLSMEWGAELRCAGELVRWQQLWL